MKEKLRELEEEIGKPEEYVKDINGKVVEFLFDLNLDEGEYAVDVFFSLENEGGKFADERDEELTSYFENYKEAYEYAQLLSLYFTGTVETRITDNIV